MPGAFGHISGELQSSRRDIARDHVLQTRLVNRDAALPENVDLVRVHVQAHYVVAYFCQTSAGHQTYIASSNYGNFHCRILSQIKA